jgi:hypothetical protein
MSQSGIWTQDLPTTRQELCHWAMLLIDCFTSLSRILHLHGYVTICGDCDWYSFKYEDIVWFFIAAWACFSYPATDTITGDRAANLDPCLALLAFSSEGSFSCHTYCDTGPRFIRSHLKDRHPRPTVGFEPGTQGSPGLCASALTTAPRGRLLSMKHIVIVKYEVYSNCIVANKSFIRQS